MLDNLFMIFACRLQQENLEAKEERARLAREKMKERRVEEIPTVTPAPLIEKETPGPYGKWETIKTQWVTNATHCFPAILLIFCRTVEVDWQLPQQEPQYELPDIPEEEPTPAPREFKEKTVESLESEGGSSSFKKRRFGAGNRRNVRQRLDDD